MPELVISYVRLHPMMRVTNAIHRLPDAYAFAAEVIKTALVALGLKPAEAARLAAAAMTARRKEAAR